jgi:hypothetical protein
MNKVPNIIDAKSPNAYAVVLFSQMLSELRRLDPRITLSAAEAAALLDAIVELTMSGPLGDQCSPLSDRLVDIARELGA